MFEVIIIIIIIVIGVLVVVFGGIIIWAINHKAFQKDNNSANKLLQADMHALIKTNQELKESITENINKKLSEGNTIVTENLATLFSKSNEIKESVTKQIIEVKKEAGRMVSIGEQINKIQNILQNSQQRGAIGEYFLETTIKNVLPPETYKFQYSFKDKMIADAVIFLDNKLLAIDAKFSLQNYINYKETESKDSQIQFDKQFSNDLKARINETAKYIKPHEGTFDFAFMYIPSETIYYDLLSSKIGKDVSRNLIEYAYIEKKVIIVSPVTLYAYLQTVSQGLRSLKIEKNADEIKKNVDKLHTHLEAYSTSHINLGKSLKASINHYDKSTKGFDLISKDMLKINKDNKLLSIDNISDTIDGDKTYK